MMNEIIAIVDDEQDIVEFISINLQKSGFKTLEFYNAKSFLKYTENKIPDLIILDIMLPDIDGLEVCKIIRMKTGFSLIPIIILSAKGEEIDKVIGLELGADDYVTKPFLPRELIARVKAVLRRQNIVQESQSIQIGNDLVINLNKYEVFLKGEKIELTSTEFNILKLLSINIGWVYSREMILNYLWGDEKAVLDRTVDVHIKNLREKLVYAGKFIKNIRGVGYKIEE